MDKYIHIGQFVGAHGVKGLVKLASFADNPEDIMSYGAISDETGKKIYKITLKAWNKTHFIAEVEGIADRNAAERLKGVKLYVDRYGMPDVEDDDAFYYADLIGLKVMLEDGTLFGTVRDVLNYGAGDILEVTKTAGGVELFSFTEATVPHIDTEAGQLTLILPEYLGDQKDAD